MLLIAQENRDTSRRKRSNMSADIVDLDPSEVDSILSFYTLLRRHPVGKYHIHDLHESGLSCCAARTILRHASRANSVSISATVTPDGLFSAIEFECLGSCTTAPVMQVNGDFYENLDVRKTEGNHR